MKLGRITNYKAIEVEVTTKCGKNQKLFVGADVEVTFDNFRITWRTESTDIDSNVLRMEAAKILESHVNSLPDS